MKTLLLVTALVEAPFGFVLIVIPSLAMSMFLGSPLSTAVEAALARSFGIAALALGLASWWARRESQTGAPRGLVAALLVYNVAIATLLSSIPFASPVTGMALWPAVLLHVVLAIWCIACLRARPAAQRA